MPGETRGGTAGFAFAAGMAVEATLVMMFEAGGMVAVHADLYGGTYRLFEAVFRNKHTRAEYVNTRDPAALRSVVDLFLKTCTT